MTMVGPASGTLASPRLSVCVYCGASPGRDPAWIDAAAEVGALLAARGIRLIYGGGRVGMMGALADAALAGGGLVTGIIPEHIRVLEVDHPGVQEMIVTDSMHARKQLMVERADGFVVLPGGLGTLDETFETLTWRQLGLHDRPILILDVAGYWRPLLALFDHMAAARLAPSREAGLFEAVGDVTALAGWLDRLTPRPAGVDSARM